MEDRIQDLVAELRESIRPNVVYEHFMNPLFAMLDECGAYRSNSLRGNRKSPSLRWNSECKDALLRKRTAL